MALGPAPSPPAPFRGTITRVKPTFVSLALLFVALGLGGCVEPGVCDGVDLVQVQTADEEVDEMHRFRAECRPLSLRAFDAAGTPVPIAADWMMKVHRVEISGRGGRRFEHVVLDGKNLAHLTGE
jgi:hypothetical protein